METAIRIGAEVDKDSAKCLADMVERIFASAAKNRMDQETVQQALISSFSALSVSGTTVTNCNIVGEDKRVEVK